VSERSFWSRFCEERCPEARRAEDTRRRKRWSRDTEAEVDAFVEAIDDARELFA